MSASKTTIFYTGATGYIGGSVLQRILQHPKASSFDITVLVRDANKAKHLEKEFDLKVAVGSLDDADLLTKLVRDAHIVIHTADADHEPAMKAILAGLKQRHEESGDTPILIHTSGAAILIDDARGAFTSDTITSDLDQAALDAIPPTAIHHPADLLAVSADTEGYVRSYILVPGLIYGRAKGPLFDGGLANPRSIQVPLYADIAVRRGRAGILGSGASAWGNVHVEDVAEVFYLLFDAVLSGGNAAAKLSHGREGYYFVAADEHKAYDIAKAIGDALVRIGRAKADEAEPTVFSEEEQEKYFGGVWIAGLHFTNARCKAERARAQLGWKPTRTTKDLLESVYAEVEGALKKQQKA